jgi:N-acyl-D-amino-acid deacylase
VIFHVKESLVPQCDLLIREALILDGSGAPAREGSIAVRDGLIVSADADNTWTADTSVEANGLALSPGFIDTHTHDDTSVIETPQMLPKLTQGVTTVVVGNCGISASPVLQNNPLPDPMELLGKPEMMQYRSFADYTQAVNAVQPSVNVMALVGHTTLRANHMDRLDRPATTAEVAAMRAQLYDALDHGALGLSTGLAYLSAYFATLQEVLGVAEPLGEAGAMYATHMRSETAAILEAMEESFAVGRSAHPVPVLISHLKCAGPDNWGRTTDVLALLDKARTTQTVHCDCYPYTASSSMLDLRQVDERIEIRITWSDPHPEMAGKTLAEIAEAWDTTQLEAAKQLRPAGAIYHNMSPDDVKRVLQHPAVMVGSDGLPHDPRPHPRLWGSFPRVLGYFCRDEQIFDLPTAVHKMTGLSARTLNLRDRGMIREGFAADLVLFDPTTIRDAATWTDSTQPSIGIHHVWVNGVQSINNGAVTSQRAGRFLPRQPRVA